MAVRPRRSTTRLPSLFASAAANGWAADEAKPASDARAAQQARMKGCNADAKAKNLHGEERKTFMGHCLKKKD